MSAGTIRRQSRARNSEMAQQRRDTAAAEKQQYLDNTKMTRRGRRPISRAKTQDSSNLSSAAKTAPKTNPYDGFSKKSSEVTVASGDNLSSMLSGMGYSGKEMYGENGVIARVMKANPDLKNANLIQPGQKLNLPVKPEGTSGAGAAAVAGAAGVAAGAAAGAVAGAGATGSAAAGATEGAASATATESTSSNESVQLSSLPLYAQSTGELKDTAFGARSASDAHVSGLTDTVGSFSADDRKSIGQAMFYETASATGFYTVRNQGQDPRNMTSAEVRHLATHMNPEQKAQFEEKVQGWASENRMASQNTMAQGAGNWAYSNFDPNSSPEKQQKMLSIAQDANGILGNNQLATDAAYEIFQRDPQMGREVFGQVN